MCYEVTRHYLISMRCVRRSFWLNPHEDGVSECRRGWIVAMLEKLERIFAIDVCSYAIMTNHYHLVLAVNLSAAERWTERDVIERRAQLYKPTKLIERYLDNKDLTKAERAELPALVKQWREQLVSLSRFMAKLNQTIARKANMEDEHTGHFWQGRFESKALIEPGSVLTAMNYVDLNPVRAGMAYDLESSAYTSVQQRLREKNNQPTTAIMDGKVCEAPRLAPIDLESEDSPPVGMTEQQYLDFVYYNGLMAHPTKKGRIRPSQEQEEVLDKMNIDSKHWPDLQRGFEGLFRYFVGSGEAIKKAGKVIGTPGVHGVGAGRRFFFSRI